MLYAYYGRVYVYACMRTREGFSVRSFYFVRIGSIGPSFVLRHFFIGDLEDCLSAADGCFTGNYSSFSIGSVLSSSWAHGNDVRAAGYPECLQHIGLYLQGFA